MEAKSVPPLSAEYQSTVVFAPTMAVKVGFGMGSPAQIPTLAANAEGVSGVQPQFGAVIVVSFEHPFKVEVSTKFCPAGTLVMV